jgi:hypothetical protein
MEEYIRRGRRKVQVGQKREKGDDIQEGDEEEMINGKKRGKRRGENEAWRKKITLREK